MSEWTIRLPWTNVPLSANGREHWRAKAKTTAEIRRTVVKLVALTEFTADRIPVCLPACEVWLDYWPRDKRRRDADNLFPTLKAACDGLVTAHVVADDTPELMRKHMPRIFAPDGDPRLVLTIREVTP
jgi:Holliday junction resolvase RusA-like endonuclease